MGTLQKFKLLCVVAGSPTRSPVASPVVHLRRRKTLRMLLGRGGRSGCDGSSPDRGRGSSPEKAKELSVRRKLKDLFVSSPPPPPSGNFREVFLPSVGVGGGRVRRSGGRLQRAMTATLRQRLLRRPWRPVLGAIPE